MIQRKNQEFLCFHNYLKGDFFCVMIMILRFSEIIFTRIVWLFLFNRNQIAQQMTSFLLIKNNISNVTVTNVKVQTWVEIFRWGKTITFNLRIKKFPLRRSAIWMNFWSFRLVRDLLFRHRPPTGTSSRFRPSRSWSAFDQVAESRVMMS